MIESLFTFCSRLLMIVTPINVVSLLILIFWLYSVKFMSWLASLSSQLREGLVSWQGSV